MSRVNISNMTIPNDQMSDCGLTISSPIRSSGAIQRGLPEPWRAEEIGMLAKSSTMTARPKSHNNGCPSSPMTTLAPRKSPWMTGGFCSCRYANPRHIPAIYNKDNRLMKIRKGSCSLLVYGSPDPLTSNILWSFRFASKATQDM